MIKKRRTPDMDKLLHYDGLLVGKLHYRALLNDVGTGDNVASPTTSQYGKIVKVIRNKYGIPVCYKVKYYDEYDGGGKPINPDNWGYDYISVDRVEECDLFDEWSDEFDGVYYNDEELQEIEDWYVKTYNLTWNDEEGVYFDPNGEAFIW